MLNMYYCPGKNCRRVFLRAEDRGIYDSGGCPRCGTHLIYVMEFEKWSALDQKTRGEYLGNFEQSYPYPVCAKSGPAEADEGFAEEERAAKWALLENRRLRSEKAHLQRMLVYYRHLHETWEETANLYHDALWSVLLKYEPENYPYMKGRNVKKPEEIDFGKLPKVY